MLKKTVSPVSYPITLEEVKHYLRVDTSVDDAEISGFIAVATEFFENVTGLQLLTATWEQTFDYQYRQVDHILSGQRLDVIRPKDIPTQRWQFPTKRDYVTLQRGPVQSISSFQYYDVDGVLQTFTDYILEKRSLLARLSPSVDQSWPVLQNRLEAVKVTYVAGYGTASDVPALIKLCLKWLVRIYYDGDPVSSNKINELPFGVKTVLNMYKTQVIG